MKSKRIVVLAICIMLVLPVLAMRAQDGKRGLPEPVRRALEWLGQAYNTRFTAGDIISYTYHEKIGSFAEDCPAMVPDNKPGVLYYAIDIFIKLPTGDGAEHYMHVASDWSDIVICDSDFFPISPAKVDLTRTTATPSNTPRPSPTSTATYTPSPTVDLTRTTATPTYTPSPTFTPSQTFTPSYTPTPTDTPTPTPTYTPSATPRPGAVTCRGFRVSRLMVGEQARVLDGGDPNRLRDQPSASGTQLGTIPPGAVFDVLEGPTCDPAGRAWWRVRYRSLVGWTIEGQGNEYAVEPIITDAGTATPTPTLTARPASASTGAAEAVTCPGFLPSRLVAGGKGRVTPGDPNNLRDQPSSKGALVGKIPAGAVFDVLEGPTCDPAGRAWWKVEYKRVTGWTVEGQGSEYFVEPVSG
jgi:hypothetical protein